MAMPESFKFDVRVRERLMRKGQLGESEIDKHLESLVDASANVAAVELKQPALQTEAERAENALIVRSVPPRPVILAAPINLDDEEDEEETEPRASRVVAAPAVVVDEDEDEDEDEDDDDDDVEAAAEKPEDASGTPPTNAGGSENEDSGEVP